MVAAGSPEISRAPSNTVATAAGRRLVACPVHAATTRTTPAGMTIDIRRMCPPALGAADLQVRASRANTAHDVLVSNAGAFMSNRSDAQARSAARHRKRVHVRLQTDTRMKRRHDAFPLEPCAQLLLDLSGCFGGGAIRPLVQ